MSTKPSPTPWKVDETWFSIESAESDLVVDCENASNKNQLANLRLIVRAVNNHERLVDALKRARADLETLLETYYGHCQSQGHMPSEKMVEKNRERYFAVIDAVLASLERKEG